MFKTIRVGIDHGNHNIKTPNFVFTSGISESSRQPQRGEDYLYYDNQYHTLSNIRIPYRRDKTLDKRFFTLTLFAIIMELKKQGINGSHDIIKINLAVGLPPKHYAELYEKYESFFKGQQGIIEVNYTGQQYSLSIQNVLSFPQDYAAMITEYQKISKIPKAVGIDIGGFTTDYLMMRYGTEDRDHCDSLELGIIKMYSSILATLNSEFDILLEDNDIDSIIEGNVKYYDPPIIKFVENQISNYVSDLLAHIRERGIDTKTTYVVFIGGGALRLRQYIETHSERLNHYMFIEDICANAKGYEILYDLASPEKGSEHNG